MTLLMTVTIPIPFFKLPIISIKSTNMDFSLQGGTNVLMSGQVATSTEFRFRSTNPSQLYPDPFTAQFGNVKAYDRAEPATLLLTVYDGDGFVAMASSTITFNYVPRNLNDLTIVSSSTVLGSMATLTLSYTPNLAYRSDAQLRLTVPSELLISGSAMCSTPSMTSPSCTTTSSS